MSDESSLTELVVEEATDQLDVSALVGDGSIEDDVDLQAVGASSGRRAGERIGRSIGEAVGEAVHEAVQTGIEEGKTLREIVADVWTAVREGTATAIEDVEGAEQLASTVREAAGGSLEGRLAEADPTGAIAMLEESDDDDEAAGADDGGEQSGETEAAETETEATADDLADLRRETLEDFLEVLSYDDLQSVAKEVGVKANLSREEMTDRVIESVSSSEDADGEGKSEDESESEADTEEAEAD